jgi:hypothetical protein
MSVKTYTVAKGGGSGNFQPGWQEVTVSKASYGSLDNGARFIDVWFGDSFPDSFNMRMYEKMSKTGEEFAIANLFRFAENAGVASSTETQDDGKFVVTFDDSATELVGKRFNIYLYKNSDGYYRALAKTAPVEFSGIVDTITENDVEYWKGKALDYYKTWVLPNIDSPTAEKTDGVPF